MHLFVSCYLFDIQQYIYLYKLQICNYFSNVKQFNSKSYKMIYISAKAKSTIKKREKEISFQISECIKKKFQENGLSVQRMEESSSCYIVHASSVSLHSNCPNCGTSCRHVHKYYTKTIESLEIFGMPVIIKLRARYYYCDCHECKRRTFAESFDIAGRYARKSRDVEQRILNMSLNQSSRKASILLAEQNIHASTSQCTRRVRRLGESNPACQSTHMGLTISPVKRVIFICVLSPTTTQGSR